MLMPVMGIQGGNTLRNACALDVLGEIACWGNNDDDRATPPPGSFVSIGAGTDHTCALDAAGTVTCAAADDGEFQIDSTYWSNWQADQAIILQLGRINEGSGTLPLSKAELRVGGIYWTVARGKTR